MSPTKAEFRRQIASGKVLYSTMLSMTRNPRWLEMMATLDFDFITIDTEHSPYSWGEVSDLISVLNAHGIPPVIRMPRPSSEYVSRLFDQGAYGILAPYCENLDDIRDIVRAARLRPMKGEFARRAFDEDSWPSDDTKNHLAEYNEGHVVMIGVESVPAAENIENILDIGGIDAVFIGPADMTTSMGIPRDFDHPRFDEMVRHIVSVCKSHQVQVAVNFQGWEHAAKWGSQGVSLLIHAFDYRVLHAAYRRDLENIANAIGDKSKIIAETDAHI
ncbi:MAG: aldolase/citrate lyase family protein [Gammaproteobacteria bacterium]|jgi:4-hydroxy-2-oxoheptanedioate aldolase|nr:aldolase/citrate lyase family protein [Gammaproteobacteria bacterium]|tara:strand:+ start:13171 stop:13992 length:822 start_codon:yes stop_codon:yes gene_type:complete